MMTSGQRLDYGASVTYFAPFTFNSAALKCNTLPPEDFVYVDHK